MSVWSYEGKRAAMVGCVPGTGKAGDQGFRRDGGFVGGATTGLIGLADDDGRRVTLREGRFEGRA